MTRPLYSSSTSSLIPVVILHTNTPKLLRRFLEILRHETKFTEECSEELFQIGLCPPLTLTCYNLPVVVTECFKRKLHTSKKLPSWSAKFVCFFSVRKRVLGNFARFSIILEVIFINIEIICKHTRALFVLDFNTQQRNVMYICVSSGFEQVFSQKHGWFMAFFRCFFFYCTNITL